MIIKEEKPPPLLTQKKTERKCKALHPIHFFISPQLSSRMSSNRRNHDGFGFREATEARHDENPGDPDRDPGRVPPPRPRHPQPEDDTPREDGVAGGADERPVQRQEVDQELLGGRPAGHAFGPSGGAGEGRGAPRAPAQDAERGTTEVALPRRHATPPRRRGAVDQRGHLRLYHGRRE